MCQKADAKESERPVTLIIGSRIVASVSRKCDLTIIYLYFVCFVFFFLNRTVTVADYISRAESQSRQITKDGKKNKDVVST